MENVIKVLKAEVKRCERAIFVRNDTIEVEEAKEKPHKEWIKKCRGEISTFDAHKKEFETAIKKLNG